jgi:Uma2 family endonuclease
MSETSVEQGTYTFAEYLELERVEEQRFEYYRGKVFGMAGGTDIHNEIVGNLRYSLRKNLVNPHCKVYAENVKLELEKDRYFVYPDILLTCSETDFQDRYIKREPVLLAEVLSRSTAIFDRVGKKFTSYLKIPSLEYYLIVSQRTHYVGCYSRLEEGWLYKEYEGLDAVIPLPKLKQELALSDIFDGISIPAS